MIAIQSRCKTWNQIHDLENSCVDLLEVSQGFDDQVDEGTSLGGFLKVADNGNNFERCAHRNSYFWDDFSDSISLRTTGATSVPRISIARSMSFCGTLPNPIWIMMRS